MPTIISGMAKDSLKVVVRLLPPEITEEEFIKTITENHLRYAKWWSFHTGKRYKGEAKPSFNSRCYFQFETLERAEEFIKEYHGHQFVDGHGESFRAVACFAPYQKVPRLKPQKDPRDGTIEDDPVYKEFVESLADTKIQYEAPPNPVTLLKPLDYGDTPLLNYLKNRSKDRRGQIKKERERKRWHPEGKGGLEQIAEEESKKPKWQCAECGTSKHLEEDPDDRGTFYCTYCWESWENQQPSASKAKKKKKKIKDEYEEEEKEEVEKRRKKKHEKERDTEVVSKTEWRAKEHKETKASTHHGDEDETERRHQKKKKNKMDEEAMDENVDVGGFAKNRWRVKKTDIMEDNEEVEWEKDRHRSRAKGVHKSTKDDWWTEPAEEKHSKHSSRRSEKVDTGDKAEDSRVTRWRAKTPSSTVEDDGHEREEKPRRSRKEKTYADESAEYWVPKHR